MTPSQTVLDPFCGTGTTMVECKKLGIPSVGVEANPLPYFAAKVKLDWALNQGALLRHARGIADRAAEELRTQGVGTMALPLFSTPKEPSPALRGLPVEVQSLLLKDSISPIPLHKTLVLLDHIRAAQGRYADHELLALAKALVGSIGNLHFGPEVGVGKIKKDAPVVDIWLHEVRRMCEDIADIKTYADVPAVVHRGDARDILGVVGAQTADVVITSPPYPNEKDYTRTTRLESVLLGFIRNKAELRALKHQLVRSNTRGVYKGDQDDAWVAHHREIHRIADAIEARRTALGKTSGFERMYSRVTKLYFGGMARHLAQMRAVLKPGAHLAYVVGDQASYLRVMIRTGQLLADIAKDLGYELLGIDLFRTRLATATRAQLREEILLLRWPGKD